MKQQEKHNHNPNECYQERVQELAELCDHEFYMSAFPFVTNKERAERGRKRILQAVEELKELHANMKCFACLEEINKQIKLQEDGLKEIEQTWN